MKKRIVKVQVTRTYTKTATIDLHLPLNYGNDEIVDFLYDTQNQWEELIEKELDKAKLECDIEFTDSRFDVYEQVISEKKISGGTL